MQSLRKEDAPCRHALKHNTSVLHGNGDIENELHTCGMNYSVSVLPGCTDTRHSFHLEKSQYNFQLWKLQSGETFNYILDTTELLPVVLFSFTPTLLLFGYLP